jgi:pSer/pThr/pTyr-binding forkhead associated (FHA) protein
MPVTLIVRSGAKSPEGLPPNLSITFDAPMVVIGRGETCDMRLPDPSVSHRHATIRQRGSEYILVDEGSTNGTFMGGVKLGAQAPRILRHGDLARVGRVWLEVRFDAPAASGQTLLATKELALALVARALDAQGEQGGPRIAVSEGPDQGKTLRLDEPSRAYVMGRGQEVDLVLEDGDTSRRHVQIVRRADQLLARDLGSKNGADLAGARLSSDRDRVWRVGEQLRIGHNVFSYENAALEALAELERAADEKIRPDEPIPPPEMPVAESPRKSRPDPSTPASPPDVAKTDVGGAPIAEVPRASRPAPPVRARSGWSGTDFVVVLLAVGVLGLSVLGLFLLLRG